MVEGRNFLVLANGAEAKAGFFTSCFVEAPDPEGAERAAIDRLRSRQSLRERVRNRPEDPPTMHVTEIAELETFEGVPTRDQGLVWFPETGGGAHERA
jgi:hypothetical protein